MQIEMKYKLEKAVSPDENREALVNIPITRRHAIACDGKILAIVPVQVEEGDEVGWLTVDALKLPVKQALMEHMNFRMEARSSVPVTKRSSRRRCSRFF
jgi:hypothetical protein